MHSGHIVARNSLWLIAQPLVLNLVSVVVVAMVARHLGPVDYGRLVLFLSAVAFLAPFINLGLRQYMVREVAGRPERTPELMSELMPLRLMLALATISVAAALYLILPAATTLSLIAAVGIGVQVVINSMNGSFIDTLFGLERMRSAATAMLFAGLFVQASLAAAVLFGLPLDYFVMAYVAGNVVLWWRLRRAVGDRFPGFRWRQAATRMGVHLRGCWKFGVPVVLETARVRTAPLVIGGALGPAPLGQYGGPAMLLEKLEVIQDGVGTALYPRAVGLHNRDPEEMTSLIRAVSRILLLIASAISVGALFTGEALIRLVFGEEFQEAGVLFVIMALALPFNFLYSVMYYVLSATGHQHKVAVLSFGGTAASLILLAVLVNLLGLKGVALSYTASYLLLGGVFYVVYLREFGALLAGRDVAKIAVANGLMALALWWVPGLNVLGQVAIGAGVFAAAVMALRLVNVSEVTLMFRRREVA